MVVTSQKFTVFYRSLPLPQNFATPNFYRIPIISGLHRWRAEETRQYAIKGMHVLTIGGLWRILAGFGV